MNCMKCGRDVREEQVFCDSCLEIMKKYPVKPGTAVQLPSRRDSYGPKKTPVRRRPGNTMEEQILRLKKRARTFLILWLLTLLFLAATIYPAVEYFLGEPFHLPGQNYSTITDSRPSDSRVNPDP